MNCTYLVPGSQPRFAGLGNRARSRSRFARRESGTGGPRRGPDSHRDSESAEWLEHGGAVRPVPVLAGPLHCLTRNVKVQVALALWHGECASIGAYTGELGAGPWPHGSPGACTSGYVCVCACHGVRVLVRVRSHVHKTLPKRHTTVDHVGP